MDQYDYPVEEEQNKRRLKRPKARIITDQEEVKRAKEAKRNEPITFWWLVIRFLPVWILLGIILFIEPTLPLHLIGAGINWVKELTSDKTPPPPLVAEPVFIVEGTNGMPDLSELPEPNWDPEIATIFTSEVQYWASAIGSWSYTYRIRPNMIATILQIESCGNPSALSGANAQGLFQVLPLHFDEGEDPYDPNINAMRSLLYFGELLAATNGDTALAFAAYNGGPGLIQTSPVEWPKESQSYQFWASGILEEAEGGFVQSPTLIEWLNAGGDYLCQQAREELGLTTDDEE